MTHREREAETIRRLHEQLETRRRALAELGSLSRDSGGGQTIALEDRADVLVLESMS